MKLQFLILSLILVPVTAMAQLPNGGGANVPTPGGNGGSGGGTITEVTAGSGLNGGGTSGNVTLNLTTPLNPSALPQATNSAFGAVKPDGTTITVTAGVISACAQAANGIFRPECYTSSGSGNTLVSQADAAFNAAAAYVVSNGVGAAVDIGAKNWSVCNSQQGWILPQGNGSVSIVGSHVETSVLSLSCQINRTSLPSGAMSGQTIVQDVIWFPVYATSTYTSYHWRDFSVYANGQANSVIDLDGTTFLSSIENVGATGAVGDGTSTAHEVRISNSSYTNSKSWMFGSVVRNLIVNTIGAVGTGATFTASQTGGTLSVTVTNGGNNYSANTRAFLNSCGYNSALTPVISGGVITAINAAGPFYNCTSTVYVNVYDPGFPIAYGIVLGNVTDNSFYDVQPQVGYTATVLTSNGTQNNTFYSMHPCCGMPWLIEEYGTNHWISTEFDSPAQVGAYITSGSNSVFELSRFFWNGNYPGSGSYQFSQSVSNVRIINGTCMGDQTAGGYYQLNNQYVYGTVPGTALIENEQSCLTNTFTSINGANCSSSTSPAVCGNAPSGSFVIAAGSNSVVVDTTAVTANSQITITPDSSLGSKLGITCNTTLPTAYGTTSRSAGTSFTVGVTTSPITNPSCFSYSIIN